MRNNIQTNPVLLSILGFILLSSITVTMMFAWEPILSFFLEVAYFLVKAIPYLIVVGIAIGILLLFVYVIAKLFKIFGANFVIAMSILFLLLWIAPTLVNIQDSVGRTIFHLNGEFTFIASATIVGIITLLTYAFKKN